MFDWPKRDSSGPKGQVEWTMDVIQIPGLEKTLSGETERNTNDGTLILRPVTWPRS